MTDLALRSFRLQNFKAVQDSTSLAFTPLTVFIGNNGSGKSSIVEGLETYRTIVTDGLDAAANRWRGFENVRNRAAPHTPRAAALTHDQLLGGFLSGLPYKRKDGARARMHETNPVGFVVRGRSQRAAFSSSMLVNMSPGGNELFIQHESLSISGKVVMERDANGYRYAASAVTPGDRLLDDVSVVRGFRDIAETIAQWQFVTLNPYTMGEPRPQRRTGGNIRLAEDGANVAEYLLDILNRDSSTFNGIIETLQYVLPYASDLQPSLTSELERTVYLQLSERNFKVPGWLLSTGTLRIVALLALLRHPTPPPLIVVEELENGLDPRTIHLIVEEIRNVVEHGISQVIVTTHSPYLLDLLALEDIVLVERINGEPTFTRPAQQAELEDWSRKFGPGRLYTMSRLSNRPHS